MIWEQDDYNSIIENEWFALGMVDPAKYKSKDDWIVALTHEREVKDLIYKIRRDDAQNNKYYDARNGIHKYSPGYSPIPWNEAQDTAFSILGRPECKYMYSPLDTDNLDDFYFDHEVADDWCFWIENFIMHVEGNLSNELVLLTIEQRAFFRNLFGWKNKHTGYRRYSEVFKYIPRKNSKTFDLAALAIGVLILDGEGGCKIVSVATCLDQAKYAFEPARQILIKDKELKICGGMLANNFKVYKGAITANNDNDVFKPLAFADSSAHGGNFHVSILDEVHEMVDDTMYNVCVTSQGARLQPLIVMITTAATSEENFCNRKLSQAKKICRLKQLDDEFLPILYYANPVEFEDDWHDENVHKRVNPMYGLAKTERYMKKMWTNAKNDPHFENTFKRLDLNWITSSLISAFNSVAFNNCIKKLKATEYKMILTQEVPNFLLGKKCYAGLDLAGKNDLCALTLDFPDSKYVLSWSFTPRMNKKIKDKERFVHRLNFCGEEIIDFRDLREQLLKIMKHFEIIELGFDIRFATELIQRIEEETKISVCEVPQSSKYMNEPIRIAIADIQDESIMHNGCILFSWQISNCQLKEDAHECFIIQKPGSNSPCKIDAAAAWMNARALKLANADEDQLIKRYEETGSYF